VSAQRVLVVEDEELVAFSLSKLLRKRGYDPEIAPTVSAALSALDAATGEATFAHVLLDLKLPDADGENVLTHVEQMELRANVVVIAAPQSLDGHRILSLRGRCEFLPKPIIFGTLVAMLENRARAGVDDYAAQFGLSPQEHAVVRHAVAGMDDHQICDATDCSRSTVKSYWSRIYLKLGVKGRDQVLAHLARWLLAEPSLRSGWYRASILAKKD
jgi:DNA-binding NarL/FixJ family response regulator